MPIPKMPMARPRRRGGNHALTNGTPTAKAVPAMPRKNPPTTRPAGEPYPESPSEGTGTIVASETSGNISRPPYRSVSAPTGIRPSDPTTTGTATTSACWKGVRCRTSLNFGPSGLSNAQAQKFTANPAVARPSIRPGRAAPGRTGPEANPVPPVASTLPIADPTPSPIVICARRRDRRTAQCPFRRPAPVGTLAPFRGAFQARAEASAADRSPATPTMRCPASWRTASVRDSDSPPPAAAGAWLGGLCGRAAAVDDVGAPQVPQRIAPGVHEAAERPDRPDGPGGGGVYLVDDGRGGHGGYVGLAGKQAAEPGGHGRAVVVSVAEQVDGDRGQDAGQDDDQEQDQRDVVDGGGGSPDPGDEQPAAGQHHDPADDQDGGERPCGRGEPAVGAFRDADGAGPGLGDQDADDVAGDGREGAVVKDRRAPLEQPALLQLGGPAGPAELVLAPAPDVADNEHAERQVGQAHPQEGFEGAGIAHRRASRPAGQPGTPGLAGSPGPAGYPGSSRPAR